jgi:hypothetical protein
MITMILRRLLIAGAAVATLGLATATPALADQSPPVTVTATVNSATVLSGITTSITFPAGNPGAHVEKAAAETYTVTSNAAGGYKLYVVDSNSGLSNGPANIPASALHITPNGKGAVAFDTGGVAYLDQTSGPGSGSYSDTWGLDIPGSAIAGTYTGQFVYAAVAN